MGEKNECCPECGVPWRVHPSMPCKPRSEQVAAEPLTKRDVLEMGRVLRANNEPMPRMMFVNVKFLHDRGWTDEDIELYRAAYAEDQNCLGKRLGKDLVILPCGAWPGLTTNRAKPEGGADCCNWTHEEGDLWTAGCDLRLRGGRSAVRTWCPNCKKPVNYVKAFEEPETATSLRDKKTSMLALLDSDSQVEQLRLQLAACSGAALGATKDRVKIGDYGWSPAYQDVYELRVEFDKLIKRIGPGVPRIPRKVNFGRLLWGSILILNGVAGVAISDTDKSGLLVVLGLCALACGVEQIVSELSRTKSKEKA